MAPDFDTVFLQAREMADPEKRAAYLESACGHDPERRARLEAMLADAEAAESYFGTIAGPQSKRDEAGEGVGTVIGRYRLLELIGEGGMGSVYLAEQREPMERKVALKIIKLGMDTREVVARFEAERQALATLDHPAIATVFDGGTTEAGRPYFVMEYVQGLPITQFCDERQLSTAARLELFIGVCQAIQHAHQKGIIHRDLKPSNILVTLDGDRPVPKVIDFGVAKATERRLTEKTPFTHFREFIGTPAYMSPEQADLTALDIDTRSDIYSLGVLLYEILTGRTPFENQTLIRAGLEEIRRIIRETDPPKPSTRLSSLGHDERQTVARARQVEPHRLGNFLRGDLDWIVMKALEKDRSRRYESASGLATDLRRHLDGEAVLAAPPSAGYRLGKFVRRHRVALTTAGVFSAVLVTATAVSIWQAVEARRAQHAALEGRAEAEAVTAFLVEVFRSPDPARDGRTITVAETLERAAKQVESDLAHHPERRARLLRTLGATALALGLPADAEPSLEKARDAYLDRRGSDHPDTLSVMLDLARAYFDSGRIPDAIALNEQVVDRLVVVLGQDHPETLTARSNLANMYEAAGREAEARTIRENVWTRRERVLGPTHRDTLLALNNLGVSLFNSGRRSQAATLRESVYNLSREHLGADDLDTLRAMQSLATSWHDAGRVAEALDLREQVVRHREQRLSPLHSDTLGAKADLIGSYGAANRFEEALKLSEEVLAGCQASLGRTHQYTLRSMDNLAIALAGVGRQDEALQKREELLTLSGEALGEAALPTLKTANLLAYSYAAAGQHEKALALQEKTLRLRHARYPADHPDTLLASEDLAQSYALAGRHPEALPLRETVLATRRVHLPAGHPGILNALAALASTLDALGQKERAAALLEEARQAAATAPPPPR
ncbi:MAG: tetratricopeptide repeat protein [Verrucomicrobiales bacterium]